MAPPMKYQVELTELQQEQLNEVVSRNEHSNREIRRARTLLLLDDDWMRKDVAEALQVTPATITNTARDFCEGGLDQALFSKKRSGRPRKLTNREEARITAIATSEPPEGRGKWTLALIRDEFLVLTNLDDISLESIRLVLKKTASNPGRSNSG